MVTASVCCVRPGDRWPTTSMHFSVGTLYPSYCPRKETSTFLWFCIRVAFVEEFAFADEEWDCWLVSTSTVTVRTEVARIGHRATLDVRRTTEQQAVLEALHFRPRRGVEDARAQVSLRSAAMRHHARDPQGYQDLADADSGCLAGRAWIRPSSRGVRSHCRPRGLRRTLRGVSVRDTKKRQGSPTCEEEQAKGRRPYLVTRASVMRSSLHAHKLRDKDVGGALTSAGTFRGAQPTKSSSATTPVAQTVSGPLVLGGRPP